MLLGVWKTFCDWTLSCYCFQAVSEEEGTKALTQTYELAEECLQINYYGAKIAVESLMPLLQLSDSPKIVNVSSTLGQLEVGNSFFCQ